MRDDLSGAKNKLDNTTNCTFSTLSKVTSEFRSHPSISQSLDGAFENNEWTAVSDCNDLHSHQSRPFIGASMLSGRIFSFLVRVQTPFF